MKGRYPESGDYAKAVLSFSLFFSGNVARFDDIYLLPSLAVNYRDGSQGLVTLGFCRIKEPNRLYPLFCRRSELKPKWIAWDSETVYWEKMWW